jgi:opacity protein-like surface antigen
VTVDGPSVLVRKGFGQHVSVSGNYYLDSVSSASLDVLTTASPYTEERVQTSAGADYLHGKTMVSFNYTSSIESDYDASSYYFGVSQDFFGDLTTISLGFTRGIDVVMRNGDDEFREDLNRRGYALGLSQVLTKNLLIGLSYETITDEGFLNNPYRSVRYRDPSSAVGFSFQAERYPNTRTSNAAAVRGKYYLPYRAALYGEYRYFRDSWNVLAHTTSFGYTHPLERFNVTLDLGYRYYTQGSADFYSDLFARRDQFNFLARDKELSTYQAHSLTFGASWEFGERRGGFGPMEKGSLNLYYDHFRFGYDNYRDITQGGNPGEEPLHQFSANVLQLYASFFF